MSRTCPQCKADNRDEARICSNCSAPLEGSTNAEPPIRYCPAGRHAMDPGWEVCPYCASESSRRTDATRRSVPVREPALSEKEDAPPLPSSPLPDATAEKREGTVFGGSGVEGEPPRRIVGVVVTHTWRPDGEIFPVREGRNLLGSSSECEIRITTDPRMSARHACIVHRLCGFWIDDEMSMNGTFLDGEPVDEKKCLPESAVIRTGE